MGIRFVGLLSSWSWGARQWAEDESPKDGGTGTAQGKEDTSNESRERCGESGIAEIKLESVYDSGRVECVWKLAGRKKEAMFGVQTWGAPGLWQKDSRSGRRKNRLVDSSLTLLEFGRRNGGTPSSGTCPKAGEIQSGFSLERAENGLDAAGQYKDH